MDDQRINEHRERDKDKSGKRGKRSENTDALSTRGESTPSSLWFPSGTWLLSPGPWRPLEVPPPAWKVAGEAGPQRSGPGARHTDSLPSRWGLVRGGGGAGSPGPGLSWPPCSPRQLAVQLAQQRHTHRKQEGWAWAQCQQGEKRR